MQKKNQDKNRKKHLAFCLHPVETYGIDISSTIVGLSLS